VQAKTGAFQKVADGPRGTNIYSLAVTREGIYFGKGAALMRFTFDQPIATSRAGTNTP